MCVSYIRGYLLIQNTFVKIIKIYFYTQGLLSCIKYINKMLKHNMNFIHQGLLSQIVNASKALETQVLDAQVLKSRYQIYVFFRKMFLYYQLKNMKIFSHNHHSFLAIKKKKFRILKLRFQLKSSLICSNPNQIF